MIISHTTLNGQLIDLDETLLVDCVVVDCTLLVKGWRKVRVENCTFRDCRLTFIEGAAGAIVALSALARSTAPVKAWVPDTFTRIRSRQGIGTVPIYMPYIAGQERSTTHVLEFLDQWYAAPLIGPTLVRLVEEALYTGDTSHIIPPVGWVSQFDAGELPKGFVQFSGESPPDAPRDAARVASSDVPGERLLLRTVHHPDADSDAVAAALVAFINALNAVHIAGGGSGLVLEGGEGRSLVPAGVGVPA